MRAPRQTKRQYVYPRCTPPRVIICTPLFRLAFVELSRNDAPSASASPSRSRAPARFVAISGKSSILSAACADHADADGVLVPDRLALTGAVLDLLAKSARLCAFNLARSALLGKLGNPPEPRATLPDECVECTRSTNGFGVVDALFDAADDVDLGWLELARAGIACATACASDPGIEAVGLGPLDVRAGKCCRSATGPPDPCPELADAARSTLSQTRLDDAADEFFILRSVPRR